MREGWSEFRRADVMILDFFRYFIKGKNINVGRSLPLVTVGIRELRAMHSVGRDDVCGERSGMINVK
jgi:hypothetical protein